VRRKEMNMWMYGKANDVFKAILNISQENPEITFEEALQKGLLSPNLQNTKPFEYEKYPYVYLNDEYDKN
jgi:hypothetical protein